MNLANFEIGEIILTCYFKNLNPIILFQFEGSPSPREENSINLQLSLQLSYKMNSVTFETGKNYIHIYCVFTFSI